VHVLKQAKQFTVLLAQIVKIVKAGCGSGFGFCGQASRG
jgi:hypothetical protein